MSKKCCSSAGRLAFAGLGLASVTGLAALRKYVLRGKDTGADNVEEEKEWSRLPSNVIPRHYDLTLTPDMRVEEDGGTYRFDGNVRIDVEVVSETLIIKCNSLDLNIANVLVKQGDDLLKAEVRYNSDETVDFILPRPLSIGAASIKVEYTGELNDKMKGFYRSTYTDADGKKKIMAVTQFEATDARRCLPCWDEPALKATFTVHLRVPKSLKAVSNMPVEAGRHMNDTTVEYTYERTPIMSSYLLAFVIGEFDMIQDTTEPDGRGVVVRVFTPVGKSEQGRFALDVAKRTLPLFGEYFGIDYVLPKIDLLAIPDFAAGAMENWGCVTYRETALLYDPKKSSAAAKEWIAIVVAHELAHQWFGNLVTMEWWTHLWLNEGFASWIEYLAVVELFPDWNMWTTFINNEFDRAMKLDALDTSHPIEIPVNHPDEVNEIFDTISYAKGASVIRLLVSWLGEDVFRDGMRNYLQKHKFDNAFTEDLWAVHEENTGKPVARVMSSWIKQMGFPLVTLRKVQHHDDGSASLYLSQEAFRANGDNAGVDSLWSIPVHITCGGDKGSFVVKKFLMEESTHVLKVEADEAAGAFQWFKVNSNSEGFYRAHYTEAGWDAIVNAISSGAAGLTASDRISVLSDAEALCQAGLLSAGRLLSIVQSFRNEKEEAVWTKISTVVGTISGLLKFTDLHDTFKKFIGDLAADAFAAVGVTPKEADTHTDKKLRVVLVGLMLTSGNEQLADEALALYDAFRKAEGDAADDILHPDLRSAVYSTVAASRGREGFESLLDLYKSSDMHEEKNRILGSMCYSKDASVLQNVIEFAFSDTVRKQDTFHGVNPLIGNKNGSEIGWKYLQKNWATVVKNFGGGFQISRISSALQVFTTNEKADEVEKFFATHEHPAAERAVKQTIEKIRSKAQWLSRDEASIRDFLKQL